MTAQLQPGKLVTLRGREWVVLPSDDPDNLLIVKPLGGSDDEITGIYLPLDIRADRPVDARFQGHPVSSASTVLNQVFHGCYLRCLYTVWHDFVLGNWLEFRPQGFTAVITASNREF